MISPSTTQGTMIAVGAYRSRSDAELVEGPDAQDARSVLAAA